MAKGFSLIELSVVLVIIGLLVGGVMTGKMLIRGAELRGVITQYHQFSSATQLFRDKYQGLPGDITNATSYWGDQATGTNACASAAVADGTPGTCNGNGDGWFGVNGTIANESWRVWQQLALAGLIQGGYDGSSSSASAPGVDVPAAKLPATAWFAFALSQNRSYNGEYGYTDGAANSLNFFHLGGEKVGGWPYGQTISPQDAWTLDNKMDDGRPSAGRLRAGHGNFNGTANGCATLATSAAVYNVATSTAGCFLGFVFEK